MRFSKTLFLSVLLVCLPGPRKLSAVTQPENSSAGRQKSIAPFLGRWDMTLHTPGHDYASWLELTEGAGHLQGRMVGRWGHAHPVLDPRIENGKLTFSSSKNEEGTSNDLLFQGRLTAGTLTGTVTGEKGSAWTWAAERAPLLARKTVRGWGKPIRLLNGKNTRGWWFDKPETANTWSVRNGSLVSSANGSDIVTNQKFNDFKLHAEFNCAANCNSGVYLRGRYEVQIADSAANLPPNRSGGAIYGFIAPSPEIPIAPGAWQTYDITLIGRTVTVVHNGTTVIEDQEIPGPTGGALDSHEGSPGPIYLQGSEKAGSISFRNITITPAVE